MSTLPITQFRQLAILDALVKQATAAITTIKARVHVDCFDHFMAKVQAGNTDPFKFEMNDGVANVFSEVRKRSPGSVLTDVEVEVLTTAGLTVEDKVIQPFMFAINPEYAEDRTLHEKIEKALSAVPDMPADIVVHQNEIKKPVVGQEMLNRAMTLMASEEVFHILTVMALRVTLARGYNVDNLLADALLLDAIEIVEARKEIQP